MVDDIVLEVVTIANTEQKEVRIGLSHLYQRYFKPFLIALHREQAGLDIKVVVSDSGYLERLLIERDLDFALIQHPADTGAFDCIDLKPVQLVAVAPKSMDEFSNCTSISMTQLLSREIIMLRRSSGSGTFEALQEQFRKQGISLNNTLTMSQPEAILDMLESGMNCVALLPDSEISPSHRTDCHVMKIEQAPLVFFPSIVKLTSTRFIHDVDRLIRDLEDYA
ncbi:LysR family transcriptional regulator substrate-binding protein [uncultured Cohaesibacter sp.]|uniref:LysR family transcriptional regulator substrate-binding protein n=1 Tax=uncultured Cohaesibacter sp. TaxID=1002546 RepID=UPI0029C7B24A|nr:LysR family transcriptional regulator substrate-binding protein [uncultured Cohaesibacter sp.]